MSERGSFVTEFIFCETCAQAMRAVLLEASQEKFFVPIVHPSYPMIIAGKVGNVYTAGERDVFDHELRAEIEARICHPVRVAVLCENAEGDTIFRFEPRRGN